MTDAPQPKPADSSLRDLGISFIILTATLGGLLYYSEQQLAPAPLPRKITLLWDNAPATPGSFTTEVWASTNLTTWTLRTNVAGTNAVTLFATNRQEFFKVRNRGTNGLFSDWSRKPTL